MRSAGAYQLESPLLTATALPPAVSVLVGGVLVIFTDSIGSPGGDGLSVAPLLHAVPAVLFSAGVVTALVVNRSESPAAGRQRRRLVVGAILALLVSAWITGTDYRARRLPVASLPVHTIRQVRGICRADLRPSSARSRALPVELTEVSTAAGWRGSAGGQIYLIWSGREYLTAAGNEYTVVPHRGDIVEVAAAWPDGARPVVWAESSDIRIETAGTRTAHARRASREFVRRRLARLPQETHTLAVALLLGTRGEMSSEMISGVRGAGASHVIALSGMHLGVLALLLTKVTSRIGTPRLRRCIVAVVLFGYVWIAGWIPSLVRALVLVGVVMVSVDRDRSLPPEILLSRCVLLTAIVAPGMVAALGFQLSVWALVGLFFLSPRLVELLSGIVPYPIAGYLGVTLGPLISTAPVSLAVFGTVYPVGLVAAGVLALLAVGLMWSSIAFIVLAPVPLVGSLVAGLLTALTRIFIRLSTLFASVPGIDLNQSGGLISVASWCTLLVAGGGMAIYLTRRRHRTLHRFREFHAKPQFDF